MGCFLSDKRPMATTLMRGCIGNSMWLENGVLAELAPARQFSGSGFLSLTRAALIDRSARVLSHSRPSLSGST